VPVYTALQLLGPVAASPGTTRAQPRRRAETPVEEERPSNVVDLFSMFGGADTRASTDSELDSDRDSLSAHPEALELRALEPRPRGGRPCDTIAFRRAREDGAAGLPHPPERAHRRGAGAHRRPAPRLHRREGALPRLPDRRLPGRWRGALGERAGAAQRRRPV